MNKYDAHFTRDLERWQAALTALQRICQQARLDASPAGWIAHSVDFELDALAQALARRRAGDEAR